MILLVIYRVKNNKGEKHENYEYYDRVNKTIPEHHHLLQKLVEKYIKKMNQYYIDNKLKMNVKKTMVNI